MGTHLLRMSNDEFFTGDSFSHLRLDEVKTWGQPVQDK
jgi:hypothetical protein